MFKIRFKDRREAGKRLAKRLRVYAGCDDTLVLALPRGGVPVGYEIAQALNLPLDVFIVRKLGVPAQKELAFGALASGGIRILNREIVESAKLDEATIGTVTQREQAELQRRETQYRAERPLLEAEGKHILLVDDGIATGATIRVAITALRRMHPARIVIAVPVAPPQARQELEKEVDVMLCLMTPSRFRGVGAWYEDFAQVTDAEVQHMLASYGSDSEK